jgi:hypothetical protein
MAIGLSKLVREVKVAVADAKTSLNDAGLKVTAAVLNINATKISGASGGIEWGPVEIGMAVKKSDAQSLTLTLGDGSDVEASEINSLRNLSDDLKKAIVEIGAAARVAAEGSNPLSVDASVIEFKFGVQGDGKIKIGIGGEHSEAVIQSLKLTLKPK